MAGINIETFPFYLSENKKIVVEKKTFTDEHDKIIHVEKKAYLHYSTITVPFEFFELMVLKELVKPIKKLLL